MNLREKVTKKSESWVDYLAQKIADYTYENGFKKLFFIPVGLATLLGAFGVLKDSGGLRIATILIVYLTLTLIIIVLLLDMRIRRRDSRKKSILLNRYTDRAYLEQVQSADLFEYLEWDEEIFIAPDGTAKIRRWCTIKVGTKAIPVIWSKCIKTDAADNSSNPEVPTVRCTGFHGPILQGGHLINKADRQPGARMLTTQHWGVRGEQIAYAHFDDPLEPGEIVRVSFEFDWPKFSEQLFSDGSERMHWKFGKKVHTFCAKLTFEPKCNGKEFRISPYGAVPEPQIDVRADGQVTILYEPFSPPRSDKFGFKIDTGSD